MATTGSIDFSNLDTALGAYCRENTPMLLSKAMVTPMAKQHMNFVTGVKDQLPLIEMAMTSIVKPWSKTFNPTDDAITAEPRILKMRQCKADLQIFPQELYKTYLGHLATRPQSEATELPPTFEAWLAEYVMAKVQEDIELNAIFGGTYNASGTTAAAIMDGFLKIVADEVTATNLTEVVTGAITAANVIDKLEIMYDALREAVKGKPTKMFVNTQIKTWYDRRYRTDFGGVNYNNQFQKTFIEGTQCEIVPLAALGTSQRVIVGPQQAFVYGVDLEGNLNTFTVVKDHRALDIMVDFQAAVEFASLSDIQVNDQA